MANRRKFLQAAVLGVSAVSLPRISSATEYNITPGEFKFSLGVASYTLRKFSTEQAIDMTLRCGVNRITFKSMHLPLEADDETIKKTVSLCKQKGMQLYGCGVVTMKTKAEVDQAFHYASVAGMEMIIGVPYPEVLSYVNEKVQEYNIRLAIHNHGPGDDLYPSAESAFNRIKISINEWGFVSISVTQNELTATPKKMLKIISKGCLIFILKMLQHQRLKVTPALSGVV